MVSKPARRHGYTTGACAAAAAQGAARMLVTQRRVETVAVALPAGFSATFALHGQRFDAVFAACYVIKDAGDDPDVTHGCEVWAEVMANPPQPPFVKGGSSSVEIVGGVGIGRVTKPGLAVAVGAWAINPVPRRMITEALQEVFSRHPSPVSCHCTISIPDGEERAKRTLNARLGIVGGLSILGTSGVVKPISTRAWTDTIDTAVDVALACGSSTIVLSTGRTSEVVAQRYFASAEGLPEEAFVMMGDHVGYALRVCAAKGVAQVVLAGQFAKLLKIACGHEQTHVAASELDLQILGGWLQHDPRTARLAPLVAGANTARHLLELAAADRALLELVAGKVKAFAAGVVPGLAVQVLLAGYDGQVLYFSGSGRG
ncbi:MAG: cobalamin biosynthesis protein CbiD [Desulfuromonadales bacterium GWC2_61_20]|nr:MAG: cobalamin biosynthesis protein CbiD [Desulfuromonadales bacterium GWC2_61_20]